MKIRNRQLSESMVGINGKFERGGKHKSRTLGAITKAMAGDNHDNEGDRKMHTFSFSVWHDMVVAKVNRELNCLFVRSIENRRSLVKLP